MADPAFSLIVPAAGRGERMKSEVAKPYMMLGSSTVLEQTLNCFIGFSGLKQVIVSTSEKYHHQTEDLLDRLFPNLETKVVQGGEVRQQSIYNALQHVDPNSVLVAVHDAVRPFIANNLIQKCLMQALRNKAAIIAVPVKDTIKRVNSELEIVETPKRSDLWQAQTPQIFERSLLIRAYEQANSANKMGTDDASLVEAAGGAVKVVKGSFDNFKLTYPLDFRIAELLIKKSD